jgi:hypothetical protein
VIYLSTADDAADCWLAPVTERQLGEPSRVTRQASICSNPDVSPDGRWLAFHSLDAGQRDIWVMPLHGGVARKITTHPANDEQPVWSPDGGRIAFRSDRTGSYEVWLVDITDGEAAGSPRRLTDAPSAVASPTWLCGGSRLAYVARAGSTGDVWVSAPEHGRHAKRLTRDARALDVQWDSRQQRLLVLGHWGSSRPTVRAVDIDTGQQQDLPWLRPATPQAVIEEISVSYDGHLLAHTERSVRGDVWLLEATRDPS